MKIIKPLLLVQALLLFQIQTRCQSNLSLEETVNYINNKLKASSFHYSLSCDEEIGKITVVRIDSQITHPDSRYPNLPKSLVWKYKHDFFPKDVTSIYGENGRDYTTTYEVKIKCKKETSCINKKTKSAFDEIWKNEGYSDSLSILIDNSYDAKSIINAFKHLTTLINNDGDITQREIESDPFAPKREGNTESKSNYSANTINTGIDKNIIPMKKMEGGTYEVPVVINGVLKISFIFDSGASDVSVSPDVAMTLTKTGTVKQSDFIGTQKYQFADGSVAESEVFIIRELKIGNKSITNVRASISNSIEAPMLLGQSVLQKFGKFTIDNGNHTITIE